MSAECSKCGSDIVYPEGTWPVGRCEACDLRAEVKTLREALRSKDAVIAELADIHHRTLTGSRKHDPLVIPDFRECACLTCRTAALALAEPHSQPCDCAWCRAALEGERDD